MEMLTDKKTLSLHCPLAQENQVETQQTQGLGVEKRA